MGGAVPDRTPNNFDLTDEDRFEIGGQDLLSSRSTEIEGAGLNEEVDVKHRKQAITEIPIRVGTLLKTETVSFLLGAGASVSCGGPLIGSLPIALERSLQDLGITGNEFPRIRRWLKTFYQAARHCSSAEAIPTNRDEIVSRSIELKGSRNDLPVNFEQLLARLHIWRASLSKNSTRISIDGSAPVNAMAQDLDQCILNATQQLASLCNLPVAGRDSGLHTFKLFLRKLLTRPLNLKRVNLFTLNYDTLMEQAADAEGVVLIDGFVGTQRRIFRPERIRTGSVLPS